MSVSNEYIEKWISNLNGVDREMSRIACEKLAKANDSTVIKELSKALVNRPNDIRTAAARALGAIGDKQAVPSLVGLLQDFDPIVASAAADALGQIGDSSAIPGLKKVLEGYKSDGDRHHQLHGEQRGVFMAAIYALERIGTPEAKTVVRKFTRW